MAAKKTLNVGMIGYKFMGKTHSNAYRQVARFFDLPVEPVMKVICGRDKAGVTDAAKKLGWQEVETDWRKVIARPDIDIIDISTGNETHAEIAIAAAQAGKHIFCEKPIALNVAEAKQMVAAAQKAKVINMVNFNYRGVPAVVLAKQLINDGRIGQIYHWRGAYLQDWIMDPNFPLVWRLDKKLAGSGALGDIGAHNIDLARYLVGEITELVADMKTFIEKRPKATATGGLSAKGGKDMGRVTVDDATSMLLRFANGAMGVVEATRFAGGRKNDNIFELYGSKGSLRWRFEDMNNLEFLDLTAPPALQGFNKILVTDGSVHPYFGAWWPGGHIIGYEHTFVHNIYEFLVGIAKKKNPQPDFYDAMRTQMVLEAVEESAKERKWVKIPAPRK